MRVPATAETITQTTEEAVTRVKTTTLVITTFKPQVQECKKKQQL